MPVQLIETIRVEPGRHAPLLSGHWRRLQNSCRALGCTWPGAGLVQAVQQDIDQLDAGLAYRLRLLLNRDGEYSITTSTLPDTLQPVSLQLSSIALQADLAWLQHKTTHRPWYDAAQQWLTENPGFFDVVFCNAQGEVCEGSRSNIYILNSDGIWLTPPVDCGLLPGVQRQALLDGGLVQEARISRQDLQQASAIRVSNALRGWLDAELVVG
ncbi:aminotransferase class IV [Alcaligenaceae bacterium]|nr:aminotransferase class IV [Alcaligenaceae bacterium]